MDKTWLDVVGFEGLYRVSSDGEIMNVSTEFRNVKPGKILHPTVTKNGYSIVRLWKNKKSHSRYVHRVVTEAFLGACPQGHEVNHKNGKRSCNLLENLEYVTRSKNNIHSYSELGRMATVYYGEEHHAAKLNWEVVDMIRREFLVVRSYASLARKYDVDWTTIKSVVLHKTWREEFRNVIGKQRARNG